MKLEPFTINVPQATLDDLRERLAKTRWPDDVDPDWRAGTNPAYLRELADYWQNGFDWREQEVVLNGFPQFRADVDGVGIHFLHVKGKGPNPTPIILTHGWPDSFYRFHKVIPRLTDPQRYGGSAEDSFDVVVPSLPGFGFSDPQAMSEDRIADLWAKLMQGLGYARFAAAGGDFGGGVTRYLAFRHPEAVSAVHLTDVGYPTGQEDFSTLSEAEQAFAGAVQSWFYQEGAYITLQATKPQTLAYGLNDSPVGLAGWIIEKFHAWSGGDLKGFSRDELLTNIMIYWATQTIGSSVRMYAQAPDADAALKPGERSQTPAAVALFPEDIVAFPREWAERSLNVQRFTTMPRGGHFAAWEEPELYAADLRFVRELR